MPSESVAIGDRRHATSRHGVRVVKLAGHEGATMDKGKQSNIPAGRLAEHAGLSRAWALDAELVTAAVARGLQPLAPLPAGYGPTTEPSLGFKASA
jgi:predicted dienelactone hydrolase